MLKVDPRLRNPCTMRVVGATMSGKTVFVRRLLKHREEVFQDPDTVRNVLVLYKKWQPLYETMKDEDPCITFVKGFPEEPLKKWLPEGGIVVMDDMMDEVVNNDRASHLFTRGAHHDKMTPISIEQNLFPQGRGGRTQRLNTQYLILFKNPNDSLGPCTLANQAFAHDREQKQAFFEAFQRATGRPHSYFMLDMHPLTEDHLRFRTNLLPDDPSPRFKYYVLKDDEE